MRVIICGGRDYVNTVEGFARLDKIHAQVPITHVIEGGARGADRIGRQWAIARGIPYTTVPADWDRYDKRAGYIRNKAMRDEHSPKAVIAFPGGAGTRMMIALANEINLPVFTMESKP